jgi:hypothetical protein
MPMAGIPICVEVITTAQDYVWLPLDGDFNSTQNPISFVPHIHVEVG